MADKTKLINDLSALTDGLLYISESEHSFDILDWADVHDRTQLEHKIFGYTKSPMPVYPEDAGIFFARLIRNMQSSGDEAMAFADKFRKLYAFLQKNFTSIEVLRTGKITVHIFIACHTHDDGYIALHTIGIET